MQNNKRFFRFFFFFDAHVNSMSLSYSDKLEKTGTKLNPVNL